MLLNLNQPRNSKICIILQKKRIELIMEIIKKESKEEILKNHNKNYSSITTTESSVTSRVTTQGKDDFTIYDLTNMKIIMCGKTTAKNKSNLQIIEGIFECCGIEDHTSYKDGRPDYYIKSTQPFWVEFKRKKDGLRQSQLEWAIRNKDKQTYVLFLKKNKPVQVVDGGVARDIRSNQIPDNGWALLSVFTNKRSSYSVNELNNLFKTSMHINTVRSLIHRLKEKSYIALCLRNSGKTHSENRYRITLDGLAVWEIYSAR